MKIFLFFILLSTLLVGKDLDQLKLEQIAKVGGVVWGIDFVDEKRMIFTIKEGKVGLLDLESKEITYLKNIPKDIFANGQGGLMDVAISPRFEKSKEIYFTYSKKISNKGATTLAIAKFDGEDLKEWRDLLITDSYSNNRVHFGSRIAFGDKEDIYFGIGDRGTRESAQDLFSHQGKILRLNLDGTTPEDNPFFNSKNGIKKEIYSFGHRNPQGLFFDSKRDILFSNEHGPRGGDEINIIKEGKNYGWPIVSLGNEYHNNKKIGVDSKVGMEDAIKVYIPSIAPSSLIIYQGDRYKELSGSAISSALRGSHINIIKLDKKINPLKEIRILRDLDERFRVLKEGGDGYIYVGTDSGIIGRLIE